ncbi:hypothetical protein [Evtepia sp.]|uniref:hypothetical protein n=1 Tax=Evtepia sp. TaxID=2773933 RepID=UPI00399066A3
MAGFRDQIESSKQQNDPDTIQKSADKEFVACYAGFVAKSIRDRLLDVAHKIAKGTAYEYRGILHWGNIPPFFFEKEFYSVPKLFSNKIDRTRVDITTNGKALINFVKEQLQDDEILLNGPFFSRIPSMRDADGYFRVEPFSFHQFKPGSFTDNSTTPFASDIFIIDEYAQVSAREIPDKFRFPIDYCLKKVRYSYDFEVSVLQDGKDCVLGKRINAEGPFLEISYRM